MIAHRWKMGTDPGHLPFYVWKCTDGRHRERAEIVCPGCDRAIDPADVEIVPPRGSAFKNWRSDEEMRQLLDRHVHDLLPAVARLYLEVVNL